MLLYTSNLKKKVQLRYPQCLYISIASNLCTLLFTIALALLGCRLGGFLVKGCAHQKHHHHHSHRMCLFAMSS